MLRATLRVQHGIRIAPNIPQLMATGFNPIINVKDYGAVGDGSHNDTVAIQNAIDAAFGPASSPHGNTNRFQNLPLYFPAGNYQITSPLYLTHVVGGLIFGEGAYGTNITYTGSLSGNTVVANGVTPVFMTNGYKYCRFEGLGLAISGANTACFYIYQDGTQGDTTGNTFSDLLIQNATAGILAGYQSSGECSECVYINVTFSACGWGLRTVAANALNHSVYGGGGFSCTTAVYSQVTGNISPICDASLAGNTLDFDIEGSNPVVISGGRTESTNCMVVQTTTQVIMDGFGYQPGTPGTFVDVSASGSSIVMNGCNATPGAGAYVIAALGSTGRAILDNFLSNSGSAGTISGTAGSKLYLRGCSFSNAATITGFSGTVAQNI